jgi:hypothetical protein
MTKIIAKELKLKFVETLNEIDSFSYLDGNPFSISIYGNEFYVFLKNISPAYFANSPDITRVQLPFSDHFIKIQKDGKLFIILGYDAANDVFVSWNPELIQGRLNYKQNVSLYSRNSLQSNVKPGQFLEGYLSNNEKILLFRRELLSEYFQNISTLFHQVDKQEIDVFSNAPTLNKIRSIDDPAVLEKIKPLLQRNKLLESIEYCTKNYQHKYPEMSFRDWYGIVNELYIEYQTQ